MTYPQFRVFSFGTPMPSPAEACTSSALAAGFSAGYLTSTSDDRTFCHSAPNGGGTPIYNVEAQYVSGGQWFSLSWTLWHTEQFNITQTEMTTNQTICTGGNCTVTHVVDVELPILNLDLAAGASIAGAILAIWAVGWAFRALIQQLKHSDGPSTPESES